MNAYRTHEELRSERHGSFAHAPELRVTWSLIGAACVAALLAAAGNGWDTHPLSHGVAALIFGALVHTTVVTGHRQSSAARTVLSLLRFVLLTAGVTQGVEAVLAVTTGEDSVAHDVVVTFVSWSMLLASALASFIMTTGVRTKRSSRRFIGATAFLVTWSVLVNFVPYQG